ncbi:Crp/Fnr family transcriptional regulator [Arthrobacter sp. Br18]|uniref:Crp/Fnr family transcriptional regulator n=1 Tax=Arthrobacter sp. Br18 TaxID=1312954 RepID=UPI00047BF7C7|nr:Crp/Fnr family transcriptional regulator [Arthrobacter sp. Br18]
MTTPGLNAACSTTIVSAASKTTTLWAPHEREEEPLAETGEPFSCLNAVELFADLTAEEMDTLDRMAPPRLFHSGELVFSQSQPTKALFILKAGRIRIFRVAEDGKTLTIAILEPGAVFGEMLLVGMQMYDNYAEALEESTVCQLSAAEVENHFLSNPKLAVRISRLLGEQVARLEERLTDMALRPLSARTAATLLTLADAAPRNRFTHSVAVKLTHEQLAGLLGATREATSKTMSDFAATKLIRQGRGRIIIEDAEGLRRTSRTTF